MKQSVAIVGMGRFGKTLYELLAGNFRIVAWDADPRVRRSLSLRGGDKVAAKENEIFGCDAIFYAVPIGLFEKVLAAHKPRLTEKHLLIDVLSVKVHPANVLKAIFKGKGPRAILTHPMFGPDSASEGFGGLPIVIDRFTSRPEEFAAWKKFFAKRGLKVIELPPEIHDRLAANSQGVTHFIGRLLEEFKFGPTPIDTLGASKLHELEAQVCRDTKELFFDLQKYNPYTRDMRIRLGRAYDDLYEKLLPRRVERGVVTYGIQGGEGSFNEQALHEYLGKARPAEYKVKYLYTSERVLRYLHEGRIDLGLFAIQNAVGGVVGESLHALSKYNCAIRAEFQVLIRHFLMRRGDNTLGAPKVIMAHNQVFRQCVKTLAKRYPSARLTSGKGDLTDTARAARALAEGKLPRETFILGPRSLAGLYGLVVVDEDLQDNKQNYTTFILASRR